MENKYVSVKNLNLTLPGASGPLKILKDISFNLAKGDTVSLTGPSGSGKSTLMLVMSGLQTPTEGSVTVNGQQLTGMNEDQLAAFRRDYIGIVFQNFHLVPTMTALENTAIPLEFAGRKNAFDTASEMLGKVGLADRQHHYPSQLSGGEQQRVALARAVVVSPSLLMADEPTGNLDQKTGQQVMDLLFDLAQEKSMTLMLITHDNSLAVRCDYSLDMKDGRISKNMSGDKKG